MGPSGPLRRIWNASPPGRSIPDFITKLTTAMHLYSYLERVLCYLGDYALEKNATAPCCKPFGCSALLDVFSIRPL